MPLIRNGTSQQASTPSRDDRLRDLLALHFHPRYGSEYWLWRQERLDWGVRDRVRSMSDLSLLGAMPMDDLRRFSVRAFIPRAFHNDLNRFITGETAGTSGQPCATSYRDDEFESAFITPFLRVAEAAKFPHGVPWLWVGPSGPHIIGKVVRELACRMGSIDPFSVDFDPRWAKKLAHGSFAQQRYLDHVTVQTIDIIQREEIGVIFTTPPALTALAAKMTDRQREAIRGVHYGGMCLAPSAVNGFRDAFPNAVHLAGYGNTLFGVVMEVNDVYRTAMDYFPLGDRVQFEIVRGAEKWPSVPVSYGERGRVMFHRLDEGTLLVNVLERDEAELIALNPTSRALGGSADGLRDPRPPAALNGKLQLGLY